MVPFGGWEMPLSYPTGTVAEHLACRRDAVVFDVSHLGTVRLEGPSAKDRLQRAFSNDLDKIGPGRAQYTHLLEESDGSVLDDLIVWWVDEQRFDVMPNASNTSRVLEAIGGTDVTLQRAVIAIQGPGARGRLGKICPEAAEIGRFRVGSFSWRGAPCVAAGTGYTGEDGVECAVPAEAAEDFWSSLLGAGLVPAGLGARDTLRLEAALPLHGHELGPGITPLQAGLGWVVAWEKPGGFRGREALEEERRSGVSRRLTGLVSAGRRPPREGYHLLAGGTPVARLTSGNFSPTLGHGIALVYLPSALHEAGLSPPNQEPSLSGACPPIQVDARGHLIDATIVPTPFVKKKG